MKIFRETGIISPDDSDFYKYLELKAISCFFGCNRSRNIKVESGLDMWRYSKYGKINRPKRYKIGTIGICDNGKKVVIK